MECRFSRKPTVPVGGWADVSVYRCGSCRSTRARPTADMHPADQCCDYHAPSPSAPAGRSGESQVGIARLLEIDAGSGGVGAAGGTPRGWRLGATKASEMGARAIAPGVSVFADGARYAPPWGHSVGLGF